MYMLLVLYLKCVTLWKVLPIISVLCVYIFFVFVPSLVCPMLPVYLHLPFLIAPSIFSNLYIHILKKSRIKLISNIYLTASSIEIILPLDVWKMCAEGAVLLGLLTSCFQSMLWFEPSILYIVPPFSLTGFSPKHQWEV